MPAQPAITPFALGTFAGGEHGRFPGLVLDRTVVPLTAGQWPDTRAMLADWDAAFARLCELAAAPPEGGLALDSLHVCAPLAPIQVLQSGANYRRHVIDIILAEERERGSMSESEALAMGERIMDERAASGEPYIFLGSPTAICGPYDEVELPARGEQHDWELELAAVIGRPGRHIPREHALEHVAGYTIVNDLTTRDLVYRPDLKAIGSDWVRSKNAPTFLPTGPWIVPAAFVADPMDLTITLRLNGAVMQHESTSDMIFDVARLVSYASDLVRLEPGDLLCTGSPAGNGMHHRRFLAPGDVIEGEITGLGRQRNACVASRDRGD
ncbi:MAG TPA: fumarylacetoacetate hydrolase family protein [Solirubrobacteraceae bacterium]|nr:fumarylacetoacetate hydrolase family protein [Solirubrobacteraceae bacterium]